MSLIAPAWHASAKRSFGDQSSDGDDIINDGTAAKARRLRGSSFAAAGCRAQPAADRQAYTVGPSAVAALRALFPAMNDQVITEVLQDCGSDIDAAIRRLGELQLSANGDAARRPPVSPGAASPGRVTPAPGSAKCPASPVQHGPASGQRSSASAAAAGGAHQTAGSNGGHAASAAGQPAVSPSPPATPEQWVDALVAAMAEARDVADARQRAARLLHAFQQAVIGATGGQAGDSASRQQVSDLQRDNGILKRAVAIQNARLQEAASREVEVQALRGQLKQAAERVSALELSNYSLAQHLRAATTAVHDFGGPRHPDVC